MSHDEHEHPCGQGPHLTCREVAEFLLGYLERELDETVLLVYGRAVQAFARDITAKPPQLAEAMAEAERAGVRIVVCGEALKRFGIPEDRLEPGVADHVILTGSSGRLQKWLVKVSLPFYGMLRFMKPETLVRTSLKQQSIPDQYYDTLYEDLLDSSSPEALRPIYDELTRLELPNTISSPLLVCAAPRRSPESWMCTVVAPLGPSPWFFRFSPETRWT